MAMDQQNYPELLRNIRKQLGISQEDLAHKLGVSFNSINRWENGKASPSKLARAQLAVFIDKMVSSGKLKFPKINFG